MSVLAAPMLLLPLPSASSFASLGCASPPPPHRQYNPRLHCPCGVPCAVVSARLPSWCWRSRSAWTAAGHSRVARQRCAPALTRPVTGLIAVAARRFRLARRDRAVVSRVIELQSIGAATSSSFAASTSASPPPPAPLRLSYGHR
ncbi:hypothetical protein PR002_g835 [Phytophthora rubi]|uniref:RxLR effector protein n=1 Tax=Phytophthora rubi TaxID=129364 RepID=A0A6A3P2A8_9STRA|nr:hypothetical protein PR002_g835 [Phytophthora rubi]